MRFVLYKDTAKQYRWRLLASNGKTVADSGEAYWNKSDCLAGIELVKSTNSSSPVEDQTAAMAGRW
jgi:uncharacterized protein